MLFTDLRKHRKLAEKRHPALEQNRFAKFFLFFGVVFVLAYFLLIGLGIAGILEGIFPNMEPYHMLDQGLIYFLLADFLLRFTLQKVPAQEMKPYLLLPVRKKTLLNIYLALSGLSGFNFIWWMVFLPFSFLTIFRFYGLTGILLYNIGIWLLVVLNNYWYLLCRILINERMSYVALPVVVYALLGTVEFTLGHPVATFTMNLGEGYIEGNPLAFGGTLAAILFMALAVRQVQRHYIYSELSKVRDTKVKHIFEFSFLERYGEIGEYLRLELRLIFRNKAGKIQFRAGVFCILMFSAIMSFDIEAYSSVLGQSFVLAYCYAVLGLMLTQLMSFEGNYIDGLMSRKESIYNLLRAKYYFYCALAILPFLLLLPALFKGRITLLASLAYLLLAVGPIYWMMFQMAVFNKKTIALNESISGKNRGSTLYQSLLSMAAFAAPMLLNGLLSPLFGVETTQWIFVGIGIAIMLASPLWIRNVYNRFMKRRYENMEGFRNSR